MSRTISQLSTATSSTTTTSGPTRSLSVKTNNKPAAGRSNPLPPSDIKLFVAHQANVRIIDAVMERLGMDRSVAAINLDHTGNTSAASVPLALAPAPVRRTHPASSEHRRRHGFPA